MHDLKDISWASFWRLALIVIFLIIFYYARSVLVILFFSLIISSTFGPLVNWFEKRKIGRVLGTLIIYLLAITLISLFFYFVLPLIYQQLLDVVNLIPGYSEKFSRSLIGSKIGQNINEIIITYGGSLLKSGATIFSLLLSMLGGVVSAISVLIISFYLLIRKEGVAEFLRTVSPQHLENEVVGIWEKVQRRIGRWFRTQLLLSLFVGIMVFVGLELLGVKYSLILGVLAALFEIVPIVGPIFAGATSALVALSQSLSLAIWVVIIFLFIQQLENHILVPLIMKKSVGLHPVLVILAILAGAKLGGIVGIILAIPIMVILEEVLLAINRQRKQPSPV